MRFLHFCLFLCLLGCTHNSSTEQRDLANIKSSLGLECIVWHFEGEESRVFIQNSHESGVRYSEQDMTLFFRTENEHIRFRFYRGAPDPSKGKVKLLKAKIFFEASKLLELDGVNYYMKCLPGENESAKISFLF